MRSPPEPFIFNCWKHHLNFIRFKLEELAAAGKPGEEELRTSLLLIGESVLDLYTGLLTPQQVAKEIMDELEKRGLPGFENYAGWLKASRGYRQIRLSDRSVWTLRLGIQVERYIHIHPGRYAVNTIRLKAASLKTAIAAKFMTLQSGEKANRAFINYVREDLLALPPVKSIQKKTGLMKVMDLLDLKYSQ